MKRYLIILGVLALSGCAVDQTEQISQCAHTPGCTDPAHNGQGGVTWTPVH